MTRSNRLVRVVVGLAVLGAGGVGCGPMDTVDGAEDLEAELDVAIEQRAIHGRSPGEIHFHDRRLRRLGGNGRACADCHMEADSFQLRPAKVEARFQKMRASGHDDPLFRPIDADDFDSQGDCASDYSNLRENALIRVRMPLPANFKLVDPASCQTNGVPAPCQAAAGYAVLDRAYTDVWRSVPSVRNVAVTGPDGQPPAWPRGPNPQGGYQLDARVDTLASQALAALVNHAQITGTPRARMLDELAAFQSGLVPPAPRPLDQLAAAGKLVFERACTQCHGGPGNSTPLTLTTSIGRYHDVSTACPRPVDTASPPRWSFAACAPSLGRNARTYEISFADGFKQRRTTSDPGRALLSGFVFSAPPPAPGTVCAHPPCGPAPQDDWGELDVAPLPGIRDTAPYFHNNSAATLEDVVMHYEEFFKRVSALNPPPALPSILTTDGVHRDRPNTAAERDALVAFLKTL